MKADHLIVTPLSVAIHRRGVWPICGDCIHLHIEEEDDGTGAYLRIEQVGTDWEKEGQIKMDGDELAMVYREGLKLLARHNDLSEVRK